MGNDFRCVEEDRAAAPDALSLAWTPGDEVDSRLLLGTESTVRIRHGREIYTLRETRAGKLILTK
ncbi:MAG: hemin uptake protein HemP [Pseudomonadota bacterium]